MNNRHPWSLKNQNHGGCFGATSLSNSTANSAYLLQKWAKWAELAVLFVWQFQNRNLNFLNAMGADSSF